MGKQSGREHRLFVEVDLNDGAVVTCTVAQRNYLINVLRLAEDAQVLVFNGRDGEWLATVHLQGRKACHLKVRGQVRPQTGGPDITLLFAPLKRARLDYMVQKATELGVRSMRPVQTAFTQAERVNLDRMRSNVIEAAEQCGVLRVPEVLAPQKLEAVLDHWDNVVSLIFCDESAPISNPVAALQDIRFPVAVLVGPEGGFSPEERARLLRMEAVTTISLGPRVMRADTATVAALALVNAVKGDWQ